MTVIGAVWCEGGVIVFGDSKRTDLSARGSTLPPAEKVTRIVPWGSMASGGAGSLGDALRGFLRSVLFTDPPSTEGILTECQNAMTFMYNRYEERSHQGQSVTGVFGGVPPGGAPQIWTFDSAEHFQPHALSADQPFWISATDTGRAVYVMKSFWNDEMSRSKEAATDWAAAGVLILSRQFESIALPMTVHFFAADGSHLQMRYPPS